MRLAPLLLVLVLTIAALAGAFAWALSRPAPLPHAKGGRHDFKGLYIVGPEDAVTLVPDRSSWDGMVGRTNERLRRYDCRVQVIGGGTRYDARRTIQTCDLATVDG